MRVRSGTRRRARPTLTATPWRSWVTVLTRPSQPRWRSTASGRPGPRCRLPVPSGWRWTTTVWASWWPRVAWSAARHRSATATRASAQHSSFCRCRSKVRARWTLAPSSAPSVAQHRHQPSSSGPKSTRRRSGSGSFLSFGEAVLGQHPGQLADTWPGGRSRPPRRRPRPGRGDRSGPPGPRSAPRPRRRPGCGAARPDAGPWSPGAWPAWATPRTSSPPSGRATRCRPPPTTPVASTSAIRPTSRPAAALATPHTWATSASRRMASTSRSVAVLIPSLYRTCVRYASTLSTTFAIPYTGLAMNSSVPGQTSGARPRRSPVQLVEQLALAGYLAGYSGLTTPSARPGGRTLPRRRPAPLVRGPLAAGRRRSSRFILDCDHFSIHQRGRTRPVASRGGKEAGVWSTAFPTLPLRRCGSPGSCPGSGCRSPVGPGPHSGC